MNKTLIFAIIGVLSGLINGLTGLGHAGAILIGLTMTGAISDYSTIVGTALYSQLFPVVAFGVLEFYKRGQIDFYAGNTILFFLIFSVFIGTWLKQYISNKIVKTITAILLVITAIKFIMDEYF